MAPPSDESESDIVPEEKSKRTSEPVWGDVIMPRDPRTIKEEEDTMLEGVKAWAAANQPKEEPGEPTRNKRGATAQMLAANKLDDIIAQMGELTVSDKIFASHHKLTTGDPDEMVVMVTPVCAVFHHTVHVELIVRRFIPDQEGGLMLGDRVLLVGGRCYNRDTLPMFSYAPQGSYVAACDTNARVQIWDIESGELVVETCATELADPKDQNSDDEAVKLCVSHPSAFAISDQFIVIAQATSHTHSTFYVLRWASNRTLAKYGVADSDWDRIHSGVYFVFYSVCTFYVICILIHVHCSVYTFYVF